MSSFALAAHATRAAAPPFNGLFYATAATVIPVLFLAVAVQGRMYEDLLKAGSDAFERGVSQVLLWRQNPASVRSRQALGPFLTPYAATGIAAIVLTLGVIGETTALISLYVQHPAGSPQGVLAATVVLTIAAAAAPTLAVIRFFRHIYRAYSALQLPAPAESSGTAEPEPGKPDQA